MCNIVLTNYICESQTFFLFQLNFDKKSKQKKMAKPYFLSDAFHFERWREMQFPGIRFQGFAAKMSQIESRFLSLELLDATLNVDSMTSPVTLWPSRASKWRLDVLALVPSFVGTPQ